jgi:glycopeptide antibiotics resistance protein
MTDGYLTLLPGYLLVPPALAVAWLIWHKNSDRRWTWLALLALAHITAVVALTIFPIPIAGQDYYRQTRGMSEDNIVPFATIASQIGDVLSRVHTLSALRQLAGNMLALMPLGMYGPALWPALRDWRRFVFVAIAFAVGIELTQYAGSLVEGFTYRVTDVDDAIMNASGAVLAYAAWPRLARTSFAVALAARVSESMHAARDPG